MLQAVEQARFLPFGEQRPWSGAPSSAPWLDRGFTGHLHNDEVGLIYMNARYYVPSLGRFASADTIVPNAADPQAFNRFSYARNNPINRIDPTGHVDCGLLGDAADNAGCNTAKSAPAPGFKRTSLVNFTGGDWTDGEKYTIRQAATSIAFAYANAWNSRYTMFGEQPISAQQAFLGVHGGPITFNRVTQSCSNDCYGERTGAGLITVYKNAPNLEGNKMWAMHEIFHDFNANVRSVNQTLGQPYIDLQNNPIRVNNEYISPFNGSPRSLKGYLPGGDYPGDRTPYVNSWQDGVVGEDFADMGANWVANSFAPDIYGQGRHSWIDSRMPSWIDLAMALHR